MRVRRHASAAEFLKAAGEWLEREESLNNMILGLAGRLAGANRPSNPPAVLMTVLGSVGLEAAAVMTPPRGVVLYAPTEKSGAALAALADALQAGGHALPECLGPKATALGFAEIWASKTGQDFSLKMAQRIYELRKVAFPAGVAGQGRLSCADDLDLLAEWSYRYTREIGEHADREADRSSTKRLIAAGKLLVWEANGGPVSMAATVRPTRHGTGIAHVYTPPVHRGHGYASACVAELSQRQLHAGRQFCCLYTDLANPTSNRIYQKIGYVPVAESSHYKFRESLPGEPGDIPS